MNISSTQAFGLLYLVFGISNIYGIQNILAREGGFNLVSIGILTVTMAAIFFFITCGLYMLDSVRTPNWIARAVAKSEYSWYATSIGFLMYGIGMFVGHGIYPPSVPWGIWFTAIAALCGYIGYKKLYFINIRQ